MSIKYPFPSQVNPLVNTVDPVILIWAKQNGLLPSAKIESAFDRSKINWFGAYVYPNADREWLTVISKLFSCLFLIDDRMESMDPGEAIAWAESFESATMPMLKVESTTKNTDPFVLAFHDFAKSLKGICSRDGSSDFRRDWSDFCNGMIWEASNKLKRIIPDVTEYSIYRLYFSGAYLAIFFVKKLHSVQNKNLYTTCRMEFFNYLAASLICLANDLGSYPKEMRLGENHNRVIILMKKFNLSEKKAVLLTQKTHDRMLKEFLSGQKSAKNQADNLFSRHYDALKHLIAGSNTWSALETQRYNNQKNGSIHHN